MAELFGRATAEEQRFLRALVFENLRQGALDSVLLDAIAKAADVPLPPSAGLRCSARPPDRSRPPRCPAGEQALLDFSLRGRPTGAADARVPAPPRWPTPSRRARRRRSPWTPSSTASASRCTAAATRCRLHAQPRRHHRPAARGGRGGARRCPRRRLVLDGEAIALRRRRPAAAVPGDRVADRRAVARRRGAADAVLLRPAARRRRRPDRRARPRSASSGSARRCRPSLLVPRIVTADPPRRSAFFDRASSRLGHEGVVVKDLASTYDAGRRGSAWLKVKPRHTLDLVVLAVEWGSGRREGWLSNIHLGARDPAGGFVMLGKTFKGMTDEMLAWQTERFLSLETSRERPRRPRAARAGRGDRVRRRAALHRATRAAWRCASRACCATATTRPPTRPTRSTR